MIPILASTLCAQNILIIESQSYNIYQNMDENWESVVNNLGMTPTIAPQSTLNDTSFFPITEALIISSGVITLTNQQSNTITLFMKSGKSIYLQGEYDCNFYNTNTLFESLVNENGGNFTWNGIISGDLNPMNVSGSLGSTPNIVAPLSYFWYGCRGNPCSFVEPFLEYGGDFFGFIFCPPQTDYGRVVCTSDQDWVLLNTSIPLMENILTLLTSLSYQCGGQYYLSAYLGNDTTICTDSTLTLTAGSSGVDYLWSTGSTDSTIIVDTAGIYTVTVSNNVCSASDTIEILEIPCNPAFVLFSSSDSTLCEKFCINFFDQSTNEPVSYQWYFEGGSPASSILQNPQQICYNQVGVFDVMLIATSVSGTDTLLLSDYINVFAAPQAPVITTSGNVLTSSAAFSYQWQLNAADIPGATNQSLTISSSGYYSVIVTDSNGCVNSAGITVTLTGIENLSVTPDFSIYPNPSNGIIYINSLINLPHEVNINIFNTIGQLVYSTKNIGESQQTTIDISTQPRGIYFLEVVVGSTFHRRKVFIE
jgi:PKD repeat protein